MEQQIVKEKINIALDILYEKDLELICSSQELTELINNKPKKRKKYVGERAIMHRFACYLERILEEANLLDGLTLDCEYNRHLNEPKGFENGERFIPDLVIHKRKKDSRNLLVIEGKGFWNPNINNDIRKLRKLTSSKEKYKYDYGVLLVFGKERSDCKLLWCINGQKSCA